MISTPIVVVFFNRPDSLRRLITRLTEVKPFRLYLVCDGAREDRQGEADQVERCRSLFKNLSWECDLRKNYSDTNLGCRERIVSGLDWVFRQEECAIILEDDCIPIVDFFFFAEEMLRVYRDDTRIMSVGGTNLCPALSWPGYSITFSRYPAIWGWATWRRAWNLMDRDLANFNWAKEQHVLRYCLHSRRAELYWRYLLETVKTSWGYRWMFSSFLNNGLNIVPASHLVENIGMSDGLATHTRKHLYSLPAVSDNFISPYRLPHFVIPNYELDKAIEDTFYSRSMVHRLRWIIGRICQTFFWSTI